ncbi:hypothetical protein Pint_00886 [Pistacia integerrima]|uniref:Uncharacterized protein n=1 Tax=Pistacia integerrima TaxID=434235 RepID=A0ACC0ZHP0_9ROSI|nr:hypothetical protein Pint_00886 [Pistacia integerrima]
MGNYITYRPFDATTRKVILSDGTVHEFDYPVTVAELMLEHPQEVVVELHSAVTGKRPNPLPADKKLDVKKVYLMLPIKRGKPASLTSDEARHVLLSANSVLRSQSLLLSSKLLPLFAKICPAANGEAQKFIKLQKKESSEERPVELNIVSELLPESLDGRPEYLNRTLSGKAWKRSLDTIKEKKVEKKVPHWLFHKGFIVSN